MASQHSPPVEADIQLLATFVSTKGNCAKTTTNPSREEHATNVVPLMGLYVQCHHSTCLVTLGKFYDKASTIHNVDDVVKVSVEKVYNGDAQVHFLTSEIQYVRQTLDTFIACPRQSQIVKNLVLTLAHALFLLNKQDSQIPPKKLVEPVQRSNTLGGDDPLSDLMKNLYDVYQKTLELMWDETKFGIPNVKTSFFITYDDVNQIILGHKCLNMSILQL